MRHPSDEGPFMPDPIARRVARRHGAAVHFLNMPATKTRVEYSTRLCRAPHSVPVLTLNPVRPDAVEAADASGFAAFAPECLEHFRCP
jgi:hypothetical protein